MQPRTVTSEREPGRRRESEVNPFLQGNFAPWRLEGDAQDLEVIGEIPDDLNGTWHRNGPNPAYEPRAPYHWFDGDGMVHAIALREGRASYRNRYVQSAGLREERRAGRALYPGILSVAGAETVAFKNTANTNTVVHAGRLLALVEAALPTELVPCTLETVGVYDFGGKLAGPMTAHPKIDPESGELLFFGYAPFPPYLQYHQVDRDGVLVRSEVIDVAWPAMMHDFAITRDYVVFILCPVVFSIADAPKHGSLFSWQPERGTRIGVMPRGGGSADVRWFATDPCYVFHPMNAYAEGETLVLDVARYEELRFMDPVAARNPAWRDRRGARLHRWRIDLGRGGGVTCTVLDDRDGEFPRVDERLLGRKHRYGYMVATGPEGNTRGLPEWTAIQKYDLERGTIEMRAFGRHNGVSEPVFVPRAGATGEDDGYVLVLAYDHARGASDFLILDARAIAAEPLARVHLPHRVPYGFHGNWTADA